MVPLYLLLAARIGESMVTIQHFFWRTVPNGSTPANPCQSRFPDIVQDRSFSSKCFPILGHVHRFFEISRILQNAMGFVSFYLTHGTLVKIHLRVYRDSFAQLFPDYRALFSNFFMLFLRVFSIVKVFLHYPAFFRFFIEFPYQCRDFIT